MQSNTVYSSELELHKSANNFYTCKSREKNDERSGKSIVVFVEAAGPRSSEKKKRKMLRQFCKKGCAHCSARRHTQAVKPPCFKSPISRGIWIGYQRVIFTHKYLGIVRNKKKLCKQVQTQLTGSGP